MVKQAAKEAFVLILAGVGIALAVHAGIGNEQKTSLML